MYSSPSALSTAFLIVSDTMHIVIHKIVSLPFMQWSVKPTVLYQTAVNKNASTV